MKTMLFLLQKEFRQILRDTVILRMIMAVPVVELLILPLAADYEIKQWRFEPTPEYGGPKLDEEALKVLSVKVSDDRKKVFLEFIEKVFFFVTMKRKSCK